MEMPTQINLAMMLQAEGGQSPIGFFVMMAAMFAIFYFLLIRPQQKRMREHKAMVEGVRRNDMVVTAGGILGKVTRAQDNEDEISVEIADGVRVKVVRGTLQDVRSKSNPKAANDPAPSKGKKK